MSGEALSKDPLDMAGGGRVGFQPLQPSTPTGMRGVGVRSGVGQSVADWVDAIDMIGAQVAVAQYCPDWWPAATRLLIRRVALAPEQVSADARSRRRRTLHPAQRALPIAELADLDTVYGYSFIVTNPDVSTPEQAAAARPRSRLSATRASKKPRACRGASNTMVREISICRIEVSHQ